MPRYKNPNYESSENEKFEAGWSDNSDKEETNENEMTPEEKTFKQRYGDLRAHSQKKEQQLQEQINQLKGQLNEATKQQIRFPKTEEEVEEWKKKYPDVAGIIETLAMKEARQAREETDRKFKEFEQKDEQRKKREAYNELLRKHPKFPEYTQSEDFHNWVKEQSGWIQQALYENDTDVDLASDAIRLYEADRGVGKKKNKQSNKDTSRNAAESVSNSNSDQPPSENGKVWKESEIQRMRSEDFEKHEEEIMKAHREGRINYDLQAAG